MSGVELDIADGIATLALARPEQLNAMTREMGQAVEEAVEELTKRTDVRVAIVTGRGRAFCSGGSFEFLNEVRSIEVEERRFEMYEFYSRFLSIRSLPVPTIAAIHGPAIGAGLCFALGCDLRYAASGIKLGFNFVRLGLHPGMGATYLLPKLVGEARAAELLYTGRIVTAEDALEMGLVNGVVAAEDFDSHVRSLAEEIASAAPVAVRQLKRSLRFGGPESLGHALEREAHAQSVDYGTEDFEEGLGAAKERRTPCFRGR